MGASVLGEKHRADFASRASDEDHLPSAIPASCTRRRGALVAVGAREMSLQLADPAGCTSSRGRKAIPTHQHVRKLRRQIPVKLETRVSVYTPSKICALQLGPAWLR